MDTSYKDNGLVFSREPLSSQRYEETEPSIEYAGKLPAEQDAYFKIEPNPYAYPPTRRSTSSSSSSSTPPVSDQKSDYDIQSSVQPPNSDQSYDVNHYLLQKSPPFGVQGYPSKLSTQNASTTQFTKSTPELAHLNTSYLSSIPNQSNNSTSNLSAPVSPTASIAYLPQGNTLEPYRINAKKSNDPKIQFDFAKYLIDTASSLESTDKATEKTKKALTTEALKWIKRLATQGMGLGRPAYPEAQFFLANSYGTPTLGLQLDHEKAFNLYVQASKQNHSAATYRAAVCYEVGAGTKRDYNRGVQFFRKAAILGDTAAMYKLGMVLLKGLLNQNPNPREAITWLKRAAANADAENPHALHELGLCYEKDGIPSIIPDESYARELYTQAAQLGYAPSQFKLGCSYEYGTITCPVDPRRSIAWYTRAAEQGDLEAELALSGWYLTGADGILKQSDTEAYLWATRAADKGLAKAEYAVGYYSEVGIGIQQDLEEAKKWYMRAAAQGNKRAMQRLSELKKLSHAGEQAQSISRDKTGSDNCSIC